MPSRPERAASVRDAAAPIQWPVVGVALALIAALSLAVDARMAALPLLGALLGLTLFHAAFGFASMYRAAVLRRELVGVRAQLLMLAVATVLFAPALADGEVFGRAVGGAFAPLGVQVAAGAFMFGMGMQLGGGCGSGTLYTAGGGNARMAITLLAFVAGSFWASLHMGWWQALPGAPALVLGEALGWPLATALQLAVLGVAYLIFARADTTPHAVRRTHWLRGPWPIFVGALVLALLNFATLAVAGHPWTITWAFTLWGAKAATLLGWDAASAPFWQGGFTQAALEGSVLADNTSVMDFGLLLGAMLAAALAGRYRPRLAVPLRSLLAALLGGLLMGYGARIAFGCNIGAFFSGVASTSLHGWLWIACAIPGTWIGVRLRPWFDLSNA